MLISDFFSLTALYYNVTHSHHLAALLFLLETSSIRFFTLCSSLYFLSLEVVRSRLLYIYQLYIYITIIILLLITIMTTIIILITMRIRSRKKKLNTWLGSVYKVGKASANLEQIFLIVTFLTVCRSSVLAVISCWIFVSPAFLSKLYPKRDVVVFLRFSSACFKVRSKASLL